MVVSEAVQAVCPAGNSAASENMSEASVDTEHLTCHEIILRLQQPRSEGRDLLGLTQSAECVHGGGGSSRRRLE